MRHVYLWFVCVGFVTVSCTLEDPLSGHCGNDRDLGTDECQCVTPDTEYSSYSWSYERGASYDNLNHCKIKTNVYAQNLDPGDTDIYVCLSYHCATKKCPNGTVPDDDKRKCIAKVDCPDPKEVYDRDRNACQCDATKHFTGQVGQCTCQKGYVYDASTSSCRCPEGFEEAKDGNECVASACDGAHEIRGDNGACVCDKGYLRFFDRCIREDECEDKRVDNGDGTCTCFGRYTYMHGDCFTVGDEITFGRYPQNENSEVPSPLTWLILEINDDSALLLSEYVLEQYTYHDPREDITWEWSNVRSYLNGFDGTHNKNGIDHTSKGFIDIAFTSAERRQIKQVTNTNPDAPEGWNSTPGGNDTEDKVFLLSRDEALKYLPTNSARKARATPYALHPPMSSGRKNLYTCQLTCPNENSCACVDGTWNNNASNVQVCSNVQCGSRWWLRSPGIYPYYAAYVGFGGGVDNYGVYDDNLGLRPALYVHLNL